MNNKQSFFQYGLISVFLINLVECNFLLTNYHIYSPSTSSISNNNNVIPNHISYSGNYLFLILIIKNHSILCIYIYNPDKAKETKLRNLVNHFCIYS